MSRWPRFADTPAPSPRPLERLDSRSALCRGSILTLRQGALPKPVQHSLMAKLIDVLMWWEKVPDTPRGRSIMKGWVYEVEKDADYSAGSPVHDKPFYFVEVRIPINRLDLLAKAGLIRDFTRVGGRRGRRQPCECTSCLGHDQRIEWFVLGIGGHTDWLRIKLPISAGLTPLKPATQQSTRSSTRHYLDSVRNYSPRNYPRKCFPGNRNSETASSLMLKDG